MRTDKELHEEARAGEDAPRAEGEVEDLTVTGTRVNGSDTVAERAPENDVTPTVELFPAQEVERFRGEWQEIQTRFVDDPRDAVRNADQLVAEVMRSLATTFTDHMHQLEGRWQQEDKVDTEELRQVLRNYRSFFNHLLEV